MIEAIDYSLFISSICSHDQGDTGSILCHPCTHLGAVEKPVCGDLLSDGIPDHLHQCPGWRKADGPEADGDGGCF